MVEWGDPGADAVAGGRLTLGWAITGAKSRRISLSCGGRRSRALLERLERLGKEWMEGGQGK